MCMDLDVQSIIYSNSQYHDVLDIFLEEQEKYGIKKNKHILFSDAVLNDQKTIIYDNKDTYALRLFKCLQSLQCEIILFQHEDMFLYDFPNINKINNYVKFLRQSNYSFIRLCRTGNCILKQNKEINSLFEIDQNSSDFFAVQPSIWKTKDLIKFISFGLNMSIWDLEINSSSLAIQSNILGFLHFDNENRRGGHYDSNVWPYIATAIVKGKWNLIEYYNEISKIQKIIDNKREKLI